MAGRKKQPLNAPDRPSMIDVNHAEIILRVRIRKDAYDWTDDVLAERAGVSKSVISKFMRGDNITMMNMFYILDALGMDFQVI